mmetsp:Transcript_28716/g.46492  ORF Transcript_28716/g.46492 Transcript_28716/m.46492 type:complete len:438 (+) Transcript_28716:183-1496(+)|eukprot:CAMPEP_0184645494 /NCGR_PEP_ID=MMETSP0308-20130426/2003_1 /TAXON_ID=38269 /ORGANISM="Gloeochaete witrockiana, Strain SAG 46.84" /LENGTH=437 /DNA_ID=CAMNT_0027074575 /DNA_START=120 /DNA_END=1433 /DNA_ORIENTATION=-
MANPVVSLKEVNVVRSDEIWRYSLRREQDTAKLWQEYWGMYAAKDIDHAAETTALEKALAEKHAKRGMSETRTHNAWHTLTDSPASPTDVLSRTNIARSSLAMDSRPGKTGTDNDNINSRKNMRSSSSSPSLIPLTKTQRGMHLGNPHMSKIDVAQDPQHALQEDVEFTMHENLGIGPFRPPIHPMLDIQAHKMWRELAKPPQHVSKEAVNRCLIENAEYNITVGTQKDPLVRKRRNKNADKGLQHHQQEQYGSSMGAPGYETTGPGGSANESAALEEKLKRRYMRSSSADLLKSRTALLLEGEQEEDPRKTVSAGMTTTDAQQQKVSHMHQPEIPPSVPIARESFNRARGEWLQTSMNKLREEAARQQKDYISTLPLTQQFRLLDPKDKYPYPPTSTHEVGWRVNAPTGLEIFGVSTYGIKRDKGISSVYLGTAKR